MELNHRQWGRGTSSGTAATVLPRKLGAQPVVDGLVQGTNVYWLQDPLRLCPCSSKACRSH